MCFYILQVAICGCHAPKLIVGPSCQAILQQLNRIHAPEAWNSPENPNAESAVPFEFPDSCEPSERNTVTVRMWVSDYQTFFCSAFHSSGFLPGKNIAQQRV